MTALKKSDIQARGISRICHFTQSRSLAQIAAHPDGLKSTKALQDEQDACFNATDKLRLDGYTDHICCSIEYPNAWYLTKAEENEELFKDWVILLINPALLLHPETRFCARNAAAGRGAYVVAGKSGFEALYADEVEGAYGQIRARGARHLLCSPTDDQAEVLIKSKIPLADVLGIAVKSDVQARNEIARLRIAKLKPETFRFVVAPDLFNKYALSSAIRAGRRPVETNFP